MKSLFFILITFVSLTGAQASERKLRELKASKDFVLTCPVKYRTYTYDLDYGPIDYCECPNDHIEYIDQHEGGPGFYCRE